MSYGDGVVIAPDRIVLSTYNAQHKCAHAKNIDFRMRHVNGGSMFAQNSTATLSGTTDAPNRYRDRTIAKPVTLWRIQFLLFAQ